MVRVAKATLTKNDDDDDDDDEYLKCSHCTEKKMPSVEILASLYYS